MSALAFWKAVVADHSGFLERVIPPVDLLASKIAAARETPHRASEHLKDLADVSPLAEALPELPANMRAHLAVIRGRA